MKWGGVDEAVVSCFHYSILCGSWRHGYNPGSNQNNFLKQHLSDYWKQKYTTEVLQWWIPVTPPVSSSSVSPAAASSSSTTPTTATAVGVAAVLLHETLVIVVWMIRVVRPLVRWLKGQNNEGQNNERQPDSEFLLPMDESLWSHAALN